MPHVLTLVEQFWHRVPGGTAKATEKTLNALAAENELSLVGLAARHGHRRAQLQRVPPSCQAVFHQLPRPLLYELWMRTDFGGVGGLCPPGEPALFWASSLIVPPCDIPVVATVNDLDFITYPQFLTRRGRSFFPRMWSQALRRASHFVVPSETVADDCRAQGIAAEQLTVIPYGVDEPECLVEDVPQVLDGLNLPERFVLVVAPLGLRKNPIRLAQALKAIGCDVVTVGGMDQSTEALTAFGELGGRLHVLSTVDDVTLSALYHQAAVLFYPSVAEGFGLPVLEAMVHGTPVVTSAGTATAEVAGGAALLVDPLNVSDMAAAVNSILTDGELGAHLGRLGRRRAAEMTWERTGRDYSRLFKQVLADGAVR